MAYWYNADTVKLALAHGKACYSCFKFQCNLGNNVNLNREKTKCQLGFQNQRVSVDLDVKGIFGDRFINLD